jgi:hypothetical protein
MAAGALAAWAWDGRAVPGWLWGLVLAANLALDVIGAAPARAPETTSSVAAALNLLAGKVVYGLLFVIVSLSGRLAPWLALAMIGRDVALVAGALWLRLRWGSLPLPTGHERWPTQILIGAIAVLVAGVGGIEPVVYLLFGLALTRLPGFWFRFCDSLDPHAYHPELSGEPEPAATWSQALRAAFARPSTRLTVIALPVLMLGAALGAAWLAGQAVSTHSPLAALVPSGDQPAMAPMVRLLARNIPSAGESVPVRGPILTFVLLLPLTLVLPDLVGMHLREVTLHRPVERPARLWPSLFVAATAAAVSVGYLAAYVLAGGVLLETQHRGSLWAASAGNELLLINTLLLSLVVVSYPKRFPHEPPLYRLQVAGGSLSTPYIILILGQLLGVFSLRQGGVVIAVALAFALVMTQYGWVRPGVREAVGSRKAH